MPLELVTVPCLSDNYAFLIHDDVTRRTALIDAPEAEPIMEVLTGRGWELSDLLLTHHHSDHIQGVEELHHAYDCRILGGRADQHRLPPLDIALGEGDVEAVCGEDVHVMEVPGHTVGHIAFWLPGAQIVFTGDTLMALGCGRLFEGTANQMWDSLSRLMALPDETTVCSGHEYTLSNAKFALTIEPENAALKARAEAVADATIAGKPTVPSLLAEEKATNPFLRAHLSEVKEGLAMAGCSDAEAFAEIRARKDAF